VIAQTVVRGSSFGGLFILLLLAMIVGLVAVVWARRRKRPKISEPSCGQCGYAVRGLPGFTCPECGSDLREVGIATPQMRPTGSPILAAIGWTVLVAVVGLIATQRISNSLPRRSLKQETQTLGHPRSKTYREIAMKTEGTTVGGRFCLETIVLTLAPTTGNVITMGIDPNDLSYTYKNAQNRQVRSSAPLEVNALLSWMRMADIDTENPGVQKEANEVLQYLQRAASGIMSTYQFKQFSSNRRGSRTSSISRSVWLLPSVLLFWVAVWLLGTWRIMRRQPAA